MLCYYRKCYTENEDKTQFDGPCLTNLFTYIQFTSGKNIIITYGCNA